jgi:hypothetical protein
MSCFGGWVNDAVAARARARPGCAVNTAIPHAPRAAERRRRRATRTTPRDRPPNGVDALGCCHRALELDGADRGYHAEEWLPTVDEIAGSLLQSARLDTEPPTLVQDNSGGDQLAVASHRRARRRLRGSPDQPRRNARSATGGLDLHRRRSTPPTVRIAASTDRGPRCSRLPPARGRAGRSRPPAHRARSAPLGPLEPRIGREPRRRTTRAGDGPATWPARPLEPAEARRTSGSSSRLFSAPQRRTRRLSDSLWSWSACALDVQWDGRHARRNDVQKKRIGRHRGADARARIGDGYRLDGSSRWVSAVRRRPAPGVRTAWASARRDPTRTMSCLARVMPV